MKTTIELVVIFLIVLGALVIRPSDVCARDIYVDNVCGDDGSTGEYAKPTPERSGPVCTLAKALRLAGRGDRVVIKKNDRPYHEPISLSGGHHGGYSSQPFTIVGNGAIIDGSAPVPFRLWEHYEGDVYRFQPRRLRYQQLFLNDRPAVRVPVSWTDKAPPKLSPLEWCLLRGYIYFAAETNKRPEDYALTYANQQTGITLAHVKNVTIMDLTVQGFQLDGINAASSAQDITLQRVVCRGNGRSGITVGGASGVTIEQCLVGDNGESQLLTLPFSKAKILDSQLLPKSAPIWVDRGGRVYIDGKQVKGGLEKLADKNG